MQLRLCRSFPCVELFVRSLFSPFLFGERVPDPNTYQGLLVLQRDSDTAIRLLHPFTGDLVDLPPLSTLLPQMHEDDGLHHLSAQEKLPYLRCLYTTATFSDGVVTVMLVISTIYRVAVATSQDHQWAMDSVTLEPSLNPSIIPVPGHGLHGGV